MKKEVFGHQGDVPFHKLGELTDLNNFNFEGLNKVKQDKLGGITLVEGEATGHHHRVKNPEIFDAYELGEFQGIKRYLTLVKKDTELEHYNVNRKTLTKEHNSIPIQTGIYIFGNQRSLSVEGEIQTLID